MKKVLVLCTGNSCRSQIVLRTFCKNEFVDLFFFKFESLIPLYSKIQAWRVSYIGKVMQYIGTQ